MSCPYYSDAGCSLAARLAGHPCPVPPEATCAACEKCDTPRGINWITVSLAIHGCRAAKDDVAYQNVMDRWGNEIPFDDDPMVQTVHQDALASVTEGTGVGSQLWRLLSSLGVQHKKTCSCLSLAQNMNSLGPKACRARREHFVAAMQNNAKSYGWGDVLRAAGHAVTTGLAWKINQLDVYGSLLDEAIRRAETAVA